jgi:hypothetical protein
LISVDEYNRLVADNSGLWQALEKFRQQTDLEEVGIEPDTFEEVRNSSPGREAISIRTLRQMLYKHYVSVWSGSRKL